MLRLRGLNFLRAFLLCTVALAALGCGDLEKDRICLGHPCGDYGQSKACALYVACYEATGGTVGALDSSYGKRGTCWTSSTAASQSCTAACTTAIESLRAAFPSAGCKGL